MRLETRCPAKVNLFLSVGPPEANGYHPIRTIFQAVSLFDALSVETGVAHSSFECDWQEMPAENTLTKTLRLAQEFTSIPPLAIRLQKRIPAQSGLGGGSSDAAGLLRILESATHGKLGARDQKEIARAVGADVPFFLVGGRAIGEGYGERLTPLDDEAERWMVLAKPEVGCDTAASYRRLDQSRRHWEPLDERRLYNDFESVAPQECLGLKRRLIELGASDALLCGSGSAVFGIFASQGAAKEALDRLKTEGAFFAEAARTLRRAESL